LQKINLVLLRKIKTNINEFFNVQYVYDDVDYSAEDSYCVILKLINQYQPLFITEVFLCPILKIEE
jgi:hypothetical protein